MGPLASAYVITVLTCGKTLRDLATAEQRARWLPPVVSGQGMVAIALTEPEAGSDAVAVTTKAVADGDGWVLSGQKIFCTGATLADRLLVVARTGQERRSALSMFVVDTSTPGVEITKIPKLGLRSLPSCTIYFDEAHIPGDALLGEQNGGWKHLMTSLNRERLAISAMCTGMAQAALDAASRYVTERHQFGVPLKHFEAVRQHVARISAAVEKARVLMLRAAWLETAGTSSTRAASMAKIAASDAAVNAARIGMQAVGGLSYTMEYPMQRFLRDALVHPIAGGSNEIQRNIVAELLLDTRGKREQEVSGASRTH
jgi:alkylation response protein AidB-like acyl-CoA dehydrogenase